MNPTIVVDHSQESLLIHWLVLEKDCPLDIVSPVPVAERMVRAPYYEDGDVLIYDHTTLVQFLQERYPGEQLLPSDPIVRAQIRQACTLVQEPDVDLIEEIEEILSSGTEFIAGKCFTILDIYIGTWLSEYVLTNDVSALVYSYWKRISNRTAFRIATT